MEETRAAGLSIPAYLRLFASSKDSCDLDTHWWTHVKSANTSSVFNRPIAAPRLKAAKSSPHNEYAYARALAIENTDGA